MLNRRTQVFYIKKKKEEFIDYPQNLISHCFKQQKNEQTCWHKIFKKKIILSINLSWCNIKGLGRKITLLEKIK